MARKSVINVKCPCCKSVLEVDVEKERVVSHRQGSHLKDDAQQGEDMLDVAFRNHEEARSRVEQKFLSAQDDLKSQSERLDRLFDEARKKADASKDDVDPNDPWRGGKIWD